MSLNSVQSFVIENCNGPTIENGLNNVCLHPLSRTFIFTFLLLQCWLPSCLLLMKIHNMGIQLQIVGQLLTTFDFYANDTGKSKHILNSKHKSLCTKTSFFEK